jgi:voltage-gated potassium channel
MLHRLSLGLLDAAERERLASALQARLAGPVTMLGIIHALLVVGLVFTHVGSVLSLVFTGLIILLLLIFLAEFAARMVIAPSNREFLREHWGQLVYVALPFLRFVDLMRTPRSQRLVAQAMRSGRSALRVLTGRLGYLAAFTIIVTLAVSQLLYQVGDYPTYGQALHGTLFGVLTGEPLEGKDRVSDVVELCLAAYSTVVFAALAGTIGAFFIERRHVLPPQPPEA